MLRTRPRTEVRPFRTSSRRRIAKCRAAFARTRPTAASGALFPEIICLPLVATKTTGASLSRRLSQGVHFPPVRARDDLRRRGVPAKTGQPRDEATGGRQSLHEALAPRRRQNQRRVAVGYEEDEQLRRLRLADIPANRVRELGILVERIAWLEGVQLPSLHLHLDRAFEHVDERVSGVTVYRVDVSRREFHRNQHTVLARRVGKRLAHQWRHLRTGISCVRMEVGGSKESGG